MGWFGSGKKKNQQDTEAPEEVAGEGAAAPAPAEEDPGPGPGSVAAAEPVATSPEEAPEAEAPAAEANPPEAAEEPAAPAGEAPAEPAPKKRWWRRAKSEPEPAPEPTAAEAPEEVTPEEPPAAPEAAAEPVAEASPEEVWEEAATPEAPVVGEAEITTETEASEETPEEAPEEAASPEEEAAPAEPVRKKRWWRRAKPEPQPEATAAPAESETAEAPEETPEAAETPVAAEAPEIILLEDVVAEAEPPSGEPKAAAEPEEEPAPAESAEEEPEESGAPPAAAPAAAPAAEAPAQRKSFFSRLAERIGKTRDKIGGSIELIARGRKIDDEVLDELEEVLVTADLGIQTSLQLIEQIRGKVRRKELVDAAALKEALRLGIQEILEDVAPAPPRDQHPHVVLVVGVNGVGKTTTIGKLASHFTAEGRKVILGASDTFRAAAAEQLEIWAQRVGCDIVRQQAGADPSAVAYDTLDAALRRGHDLVLVDTAGRLHTKVNLMEELKKVHRVIGKRLEGAPHEVILVLDATTGQNAVNQAKLFHEAVPLTGIILTKLDGTAKGGVVVAIAAEMKLPILYVGLGEGIDDLRPFEAEAFARAIFG
ncbi:MAG: signal recognition particle-docking protein FtsY [Deltaproteobacteria bacterium]|nr:signal recognition particle-docking protein FtsY [Deltaproteobacteria bacterium]